MKFLKTLLLVALCKTGSYSMAQTYISFPNDSAYWCMKTYYGTHDTGIDGYNIYSYIILNDTIIKSKAYKNIGKIRRYSYTYVSGHSYDNDIYEGLIGGLRQQDKVVYFYKYTYYDGGLDDFDNLPDTTDYVLYNFNLSIGDTMNFGSNMGTLYSIDSIQLLDETFRKTYKFSLGCIPETTTWVEGIGDIVFGLFTGNVYCGEGPPGYSFISFTSHDAELIHGIYEENSCAEGGVDVVPEMTGNDVTINVGNNNTIEIQASTDLIGTEVRIFDIYGITNYAGYLSGNKFNIDISILSQGYYICSLFKQNEQMANKKFVIVRD